MIDKNIRRAADDKFEGHEIELSFRPLYNITWFYISSREMEAFPVKTIQKNAKDCRLYRIPASVFCLLFLFDGQKMQ